MRGVRCTNNYITITACQTLHLAVSQYLGMRSLDETGKGVATGASVNIPLPASYGYAEYLPAFEQIMVPIVRRFRPWFTPVSTGYDYIGLMG